MSGRRSRRGWLLAVLVIAAASLAVARTVLAHPMGNFSISHYTEIRVEADALELRYLIDMAEIPTFQEIQDGGLVAQVGHPTLTGYLARKIEILKDGLRVEIDGRPLSLATVSSDVIVPPGAGGLPTLKLGAVYRARLVDLATDRVHDLRYRDANFPDRVGWKEIVAREGRGMVLMSSSAPTSDRSDQLTTYPTDLLNSPPQDVEAHVVFARQPQGLRLAAAPSSSSSAPAPPRAGPPARSPETGRAAVARADGGAASLALQANTLGTPRSSFTELMTTDRLGVGIILIALAVAAGLGALHALEPGHGKTLVAAYLVGSHGTLRHAALLGLVVTVTHTSAVYLLGGVTLYASQYVVPERLYPWLGLISGIAVAGVGVSLFLRYVGRRASRHAHDHTHHAHGHQHEHAHAHHSHGPDTPHEHSRDGHHHLDAGGKLSIPALLALGVTGGMVPCPAALVVLLSALSLQRVGFGLLLIAAFSVGLAAVLIGLGLVMVCARRFASRVRGDGALITRWLPLASSVVITLTGVGLTVQALAAVGVL